MWKVLYSIDPLCPSATHGEDGASSVIATGSVDIKEFLTNDADAGDNQQPTHQAYEAFVEGGRTAKVVLADTVARAIADLAPVSKSGAKEGTVFTVEPLHKMLTSIDSHAGGLRGRPRSGSRHLRRAMTKKLGAKSSKHVYPPYILERTDVWCDGTTLYATLRIITEIKHDAASEMVVDEKKVDCAVPSKDDTAMADVEDDAPSQRDSIFIEFLLNVSNHIRKDLLRHVASSVLQDRLRTQLISLNAVAFVANGSILPRRSGASSMPMSSPPAIPFEAPGDSPMTKEIMVDMGQLRAYLDDETIPEAMPDKTSHVDDNGMFRLTGLVVSRGVTLIVGGGYHGKSTLLRTIAAGVYNKVMGDGREKCVTVRDAVTVRAEDGRYVNKCNVSAFISNLPTPPGVTAAIDTSQFSTGEASGSTSQASNVSEAIEMGASAMLVDEDVSAANFMARDGRMRSIVMDESITPLLYRVNGMYNTLGISSIVVVGGVGDWLDVPHNVIKMDKYLVYDATKKAMSVSKQFSHGHVQYAGRGVVHRLPWDKSGTPNQRRPTNASSPLFRNSTVSLLEGGGRISLCGDYNYEDSTMIDEDEDDDLGVIDMSRCEQLMGRSEQLYGCGLCVAWLLKAAEKDPTLGLRALLDKLDDALDQNGLNVLLSGPDVSSNGGGSDNGIDMLETLGFVYRPRRYEVAMALTRMRGILFEEIPVVDDGSEAKAQREAEERKKALAELWASRRKKGAR